MMPFVFVAAALALAANGTIEGDPNDIDNFHRIDARVCTGGQPTKDQIVALRDAGVRTILNLREAEEHNVGEEHLAADEAGLRYIHIPVRASAPAAWQAKAFLGVLSSSEVYPIYIHCGSGNRVGAFWMIRRILVDGWDAEAAEKEARKIGLKSESLRDFALAYARAHASARSPSPPGG
jgi:uncharacterized protein (TIGR01244 family)